MYIKGEFFMKLKYEFILSEVADKFVAVPIGDDAENFRGLLKTNDVGAYILNMLKDDIAEEEIVIAMVKDYPEDTEEEIRDVASKFIATLKENDLLV